MMAPSAWTAAAEMLQAAAAGAAVAAAARPEGYPGAVPVAGATWHAIHALLRPPPSACLSLCLVVRPPPAPGTRLACTSSSVRTPT